MSASFIAIVLVAAIVIVNWRLFLLISVSVLVALMVFGMGIVQPEQPPAAGSGSSSGQVVPNGQLGAVVGQPGPR